MATIVRSHAIRDGMARNANPNVNVPLKTHKNVTDSKEDVFVRPVMKDNNVKTNVVRIIGD